MAQTSRFWDGTALGDATAAPYDAANEFAAVMRSVSGAGGIATNQGGVFRGELNELAVTGAATPVSINTGRAINQGTWFEQDASSTIAIPTPAVSTRVDVIVLRKDWVAQTVRLFRVAGTEGAGVPAITQIAGTTWDIPLANVSIVITTGVITLTDRRQFLGGNLMMNIRTFGVGDMLYADTSVSVAKLPIGTANQVLQTNAGATAPAWTSTLLLGLGAVATPTYSFIGDANTGLWSPGADIIAWSTGGSEGARLTAGLLTIATAMAVGTNPAVSGAIRIPYLGAINARNSTNTADGIAFSIAGAATIQMGGATFTDFALPNAGHVLIGTSTVSSFNTTGIVIQQGGADNEIVSFKSSDVATGMTSITDTDTFGYMQKYAATQGGLSIRGLGMINVALELHGFYTSGVTSKVTGSGGAIVMNSALKSGTSVGAPGGSDNLMVIRANETTRFIFQSDGTSYEDVGTAWVNYDEHDDLALLTDMSIAVSRADDAIHSRFASFLRYSPDMLQAMDLIHFNADGHHFANRSKIQMLLIGASRQLGERTTSIEQRVTELEAENTKLRELIGV